MTTIEPMTEAQANALAAVLAEIRPGDWKPPQLLKLLWDHRAEHPYPSLALAAVKAALNPAVKSPAVIFMPGNHWSSESESKLPRPRPKPCPAHIGESEHNCRCCAADRKAEPPLEAVPTGAASHIEGEKTP